MSTIAFASVDLARERQLDWLLDEVLAHGAQRAHGAQGAARARAGAQRAAFPWLAAAIALFAAGAAVGVAWLRAGEPRREAQQPAIPWHECHGAGALDAVPADVRALKCFDFDDAACTRLAKLTQLEHLDLSGMDVNAEGYAVSLQITDAGVRALAPLVALRSLSLASCQAIKGEALQVLEAMPQLESLDLTYSGVETAAIERLVRLPALRTLVLSHCMSFHGKALAAVASLPGLRRLELQGCVTLSAADALHLAKLKALRHLDLRDCQGRFRGQTMQVPQNADPGVDDFESPAPAPTAPVQDGIGITDKVVAALAALPLETLLLGGSESLTDAIGEPLAKMTTLRVLDLSNLPKMRGPLLAQVPPQLEDLRLEQNWRLRPEDLRHLPALPRLRAFGLGGLPLLDDATLRMLLDGKQLVELGLGGPEVRDKGGRGTELTQDPSLTAAAFDLIAAQTSLELLRLGHRSQWFDGSGLQRVASLPKLRTLDLTWGFAVTDADLARLAASRSLQSLKLMFCRRVTGTTLDALAGLPLRELDLYGTRCDPARVQELAAKHWPGCVVTMPKGQRWRAK